jgi:putative colanic acid biosynthesis UDP-glucose lipid carrier transferase
MQQQGKIRQYDSKLNAIARLSDTAIIFLTFFALLDVFDAEWHDHYLWMLLAATIGFNFFAESLDAYRSWRGTQLSDEISTIFSSWLTLIVFLVFIDLTILHTQLYYLPHIVIWGLLTPLELISWHVLVRMILGELRSRGYNSRNVAIVGATKIGRRLETAFSEMDWIGYELVGYYDDRANSREKGAEDIAIKGNVDRLINDCQNGKIDAVYITLALAAEKRVKEIAERLSDSTASVYLVPDVFTFNLLNSRWVDLQGITAISIYETPFAGVNNIVKRMEDIVLSILILILIAVPMLFIAIGVKATSKGPVLFKQSRYGMDGEKIKVWKFRSMTVTEDGDKVTQATKNDKRITPFGGFLRRTSLDELPQFFNSLMGTMSIVGPRPHAIAHNEEYRKQIHGYMLRHKVKPGITGLAQINGFRGETDTLDKMQGRIHYDLQYIQTWSLSLDLKIIFLTIFKGFKSENAY